MSAGKARFLSPEEKELAFHRIQVDSSSIVDEEFNLRESVKVFRMPVAWAWLAIEMCLGVPLQSVSLFLPQIVERLGYSVVKTNLYTVGMFSLEWWKGSGGIELILRGSAECYRCGNATYIGVYFRLHEVAVAVYCLGYLSFTIHMMES